MQKILVINAPNFIQHNWQINHLNSNKNDQLEDNISVDNYDCILINNTNTKLSFAIIQQLRLYFNFYKEIGTLAKPSEFANFHYNDNDDISNHVNNAIKRNDLVKHIIPRDNIHRFIKYLFVHPLNSLTQYEKFDRLNIFYFPQIEVFEIQEHLLENILDELDDLGLIASKSFKDCCFACIMCNSEMLKFNEVCPSCNSTNVIASKFIHCFKCGNVDIETKFLQDDKLSCPNCNKTLLLIGNDYDRPLDTSQCRKCQEIFIDGPNYASCLNCHHLHTDISLLNKHYHFNYILQHSTDEKFIRYINDEVLYLFDKLNYVTKEYFKQILQWLITLHKRHADEEFVLIALNLGQLSNEVNLRTLAIKFKELLRPHDLYCRLSSNNQVLILFPKVGSENKQALVTRMHNIIQSCLEIESSENMFNSYTPSELTESEINNIFKG